MSPRVLLPLLVAFWPVWRWYAARAAVAGDEYAVVALATLLAVVAASRPRRRHRGREPFLTTAACVLVYARLQGRVPPTVGAIVAATALAFAVGPDEEGRRMPHPAMLGLLWLALPTLPTVQFFAGYPLRALVAHLTALLLSAGGFTVASEGALLLWHDSPVAVDAPCSGIRMLWASGYLVCTLAAALRLSPARTVVCGLAALGLTVLANVLRTAALLPVEAGFLDLPAGIHSAVGLVVFLLLATSIGLLVEWARRRQFASAPSPRHTDTPAVATTGTRRGFVPFLASCLLAAVVPLLPTRAAPTAPDAGFPGWPASWEGRPLRMDTLPSREAEFLRGLPGRTARFTDGTRAIIVRWVTEPSRLVHPITDCLRAQGANVVAMPLHVDAEGRRWGTAEARIGGHRTLVRETFEDAAGNSWADASDWYWAAILGRTEGPWWGYVVAQSLEATPPNVSSQRPGKRDARVPSHPLSAMEHSSHRRGILEGGCPQPPWRPGHALAHAPAAAEDALPPIRAQPRVAGNRHRPACRRRSRTPALQKTARSSGAPLRRYRA